MARITADEVKALVDSIAAGQTEESWLELKGSWWALDVPKARDEFLKDIAGMANAKHEGPQRVILVGVHEDGAVEPAPLPRDEAELQQMLLAITPHPNVAFTQVDLREGRITVIAVLAPYDQPYVVKRNGAENVVYVRMGSRVGTATRPMLDAMYSRTRRHPTLVVGWLDQPVLRLPAPSGIGHAAKLAVLDERLAAMVADAVDVEAAYKSVVAAQITRLQAFRNAIADPTTHHLWYLSTHVSEDAVAVQIEVHNDGNAPATAVHVEIELPEWLLALDEDAEVAGYEGPTEPGLETVDQIVAAQRVLRTFPSIVVAPTWTFAPLPAMRPFPLSPVPRQNKAWIEPHEIELQLADLDHQHVWNDVKARLIALPGALVGEHRIAVRVFCQEFEDWHDADMIVHVG